MSQTADMITVMEFIKTLEPEKFDERALDEVVHDTAATQASDANNGGVKSQVAFLLSNGWTAETIVGYIKAEY